MTRVRSKTLLVRLFVMLAAGSLLPAVGQNRNWRSIENQPLIKFNWGCSSTDTFPGALKPIVRTTMRRNDFEGFGTWGDRAFVFDLNRDRKPEYFVPLDCGATGNCTWGIFSMHPNRFLGLLVAQYIYVHERKSRYPDLITYIHLSAAEGILKTYRFRGKQYAWLGDKYETTTGIPRGNDLPAFLKKARAECKEGND
jgi:hypothetical protein